MSKKKDLEALATKAFTAGEHQLHLGYTLASIAEGLSQSLSGIDISLHEISESLARQSDTKVIADAVTDGLDSLESEVKQVGEEISALEYTLRPNKYGSGPK